ncbi:hypothetical protein [Paracoccus sp. SCN 68-21]|uniref:hypothetical protein n=1 Tax=Paracoccus sp. SCN 68-21 TaxID=1660154 RepID=UPI00257F10B6|nr:hypothetical protein [Paracoccus sp. SCN 68-21]
MSCDARRWPLTDQVWRQFGQFDLVMERTGVDPVFAARKARGTAIAQARNICLVCLHHKRCRSLLEEDEAHSIVAFSPNAGFFDQCRQHRLPKTRNMKRDS